MFFSKHSVVHFHSPSRNGYRQQGAAPPPFSLDACQSVVKVYPHLGGRSPLVGCALTSGGYLGSVGSLFLTFLFSFFTKLLSFPFFSFHFFVSCCFLAVTQCPSGCETLGKPNAIAAAGAGLAIAAVRHSKAFFTKILSLQSDKKTQKRNMTAADTIVKDVPP